MILAFDTYYFDNKAKTVCLEFENWDEDKNFKIYTTTPYNLTKSARFFPALRQRPAPGSSQTSAAR